MIDNVAGSNHFFGIRVDVLLSLPILTKSRPTLTNFQLSMTIIKLFKSYFSVCPVILPGNKLARKNIISLFHSR